MKRIARILCMILAALMIFSSLIAFSACKDKNDGEKGEKSKETTEEKGGEPNPEPLKKSYETKYYGGDAEILLENGVAELTSGEFGPPDMAALLELDGNDGKNVGRVYSITGTYKEADGKVIASMTQKKVKFVFTGENGQKYKDAYLEWQHKFADAWDDESDALTGPNAVIDAIENDKFVEVEKIGMDPLCPTTLELKLDKDAMTAQMLAIKEETAYPGGKSITLLNENGDMIGFEDYDASGALLLVEVYDENGSLRSAENYENGIIVEKFEYDENGDLVYKTHYEEGKVEFVDTYEKNALLYREYPSENGKVARRKYFDENGRIVRESEFSESGKLVKMSTRDANGVIVAVNEYDENENLVRTTRYEEDATFVDTFDGNGKLTEETVYDTNGKVISSEKYVYDDKGNLIEVGKYDENGELLEKEKFTLDENGNKIASITTDAKGTVLYESEFYASGRQKTLKTYEDGKLLTFETYNEDGNLVEKIDYYEDSQNRYVYEYNAAGVRTGGKMYDENGNVLGEFTYDENGNDLSERYYDEKGNLTSEGYYDPDGTYHWKTYWGGKISYQEIRSANEVTSMYYDEFLNYYGKAVIRYNVNNEILEELEYDKFDNLVSDRVNVYDEMGRLVSYTTLDGSGKKIETGEFEYYVTTGEMRVWRVRYGDGALKIERDYYENGEISAYYSYYPSGKLENQSRYDEEGNCVYDASYSELGFATYERVVGEKDVTVTAAHDDGKIYRIEKWTLDGELISMEVF